MDDKTAEFYEKNAPELMRLYNSVESHLKTLVPLLFKQGSKVLDVGCGSGRDLSLLLELGYDAYGLEPSNSLRKLTLQNHPNLAERIFAGSLPDQLQGVSGLFDNVILSAVIMHIPDNQLFESAYALRSILKKNGLLIISHCTTRDNILKENRDEKGRLYILRSSEQLLLLFEELGFVKHYCFHSADTLERKATNWETLVLEYSGEERSETVDKIEHVINSDSKTATYKLALLRALCDIAQNTPYCAHWTAKGRVKVPINYISDKWIEYYLPMMGNSVFVPNNRGEHPEAKKPIAFRELLTEFSINYTQVHGLAQFIDDRDRGKFTKENEELYRKIKKKINNTIKVNPVKYTSGNIFKYEKEDKSVSMDGALWREMVILGHWIEDSLILKWAQLINTFSKSTIEFPINQALELMLQKPEMERRVGPARHAYESQTKLHCVWSNKFLSRNRLVIDHAIPFSIRHDNSLWNLLPADKSVNSEKSDKLPEASLLNRQRDALIHNWQLLYSCQNSLFSSETCRFLGCLELSQKSWEIDLFNRFFETVENTANRRGIERWSC